MSRVKKMKKVIIIFLSFFLLFSTIDYGVSKPLSLESSIVSSERSINLNVADNVHEPLNFSNIKKFNGHFIENQGQIKEEIVKYYLQGKGVWFLNDGVVF